MQLFRRQEELQNYQHQNSKKLTANQRHILERREETATPGKSHFTHVSGSGAIFSANRQALQQSHQQKKKRCPKADGLIGRKDSNSKRTKTHHADRNQHRSTATELVREPTKQPTANRAHKKTGCKNGRRVQQLTGLIFSREKL